MLTNTKVSVFPFSASIPTADVALASSFQSMSRGSKNKGELGMETVPTPRQHTRRGWVV